MVYVSNVTAKASTSGARLVMMVAFDSISSSLTASGKESESSRSAGDSTSPGAVLVRFLAGVLASDGALRFLLLRFAAFRTCLAIFSSSKIGCSFSNPPLAMSSTLRTILERSVTKTPEVLT
jgi:hypothetical protein